MVKAKHTFPDGRVGIVMGISAENVKRLRNGELIYFDPMALKIAPGTAVGAISVFYGETDEELARTLKTLIGPQTEVIVVPRGDGRTKQ